MQPKDSNFGFSSEPISFELNDLADDPITQFETFFAMHKERVEKQTNKPLTDLINRMTISTASKDGYPSSRYVLLKYVDDRGFVFNTHYISRKGEELTENPRAALVFFWKQVNIQVRVEGDAKPISAEESDKIWRSRPLGSQVATKISKQSQPVSSREELDRLFKEEMALHEGKEYIDRPDTWGGYVIQPRVIEFWQGGAYRLADRVRYTLNSESTTNDRRHGEWTKERLFP
jgi:pyridoxamine 5'-phosphate oxidase